MKMVLSPYHPSFLPAVHAWRNAKEALRYNPLLPMSRDDLSQHLAGESASFERLSTAAANRWYFLVAGKPVGTVSFQNISLAMGYGEIGYMVGEEHYGKGYATRGVALFLNELFSRTPIRRVSALVHEENAGSHRVMEKLGFVKEGLLREHYLIQGKPVNEIYYGLLKSDWEQNPALKKS